MKKTLMFLPAVLLAACVVSTSSTNLVDMPGHYDSERVQQLFKTIAFEALLDEVYQKFLEVRGKLTGFAYAPLVFQSATGKPDRMVVRVDLKPATDWSRKEEVQTFLVNYLKSKIVP